MSRGFLLRFYALDGSLAVEQRFAALPIRIGRNALNDCRINQNFISDFHLRLEDSEGRLCIRDLNSKNGVFVRSPSNNPPSRIAPQMPIDLGPHKNEFFMGPVFRGVITAVEMEGEFERPPGSSGTVLGNRQMLQVGLPAAATGGGGPGALPNLPGLASLPPLEGAPKASFGPPPSAHLSQAGPNGPAGPMPDLKKTGHFGMAMEILALQGLRELAGSLVPGRPLETNGDVARLITKIHDTIEVFCRCFIPLREGYAQFVSSMDLQKAAMQRSVNRSRSYMAVETAKDPSTVAVALLDWRDQSLDAPKAIEGTFADLMVHQVALLDGVMQGMRALLEELSPENIEKMVDDREGRGPLGLNIGRYKGLWEAFRQRYEELSEEKQAFSHIFGPEFTEAYREYRRRRPDTSRTP